MHKHTTNKYTHTHIHTNTHASNHPTQYTHTHPPPTLHREMHKITEIAQLHQCCSEHVRAVTQTNNVWTTKRRHSEPPPPCSENIHQLVTFTGQPGRVDRGGGKKDPKKHPHRKIRFGHDGIVCGACGRTRVCVVVQSIVGAVRARSNKGKHLKSTSNHTYTERKRDIRSNKVTTAVELRKLVKNEGARAEQNKDVTCISLQGLQARQDKQRKWGNIILPHPLPTN